jgi:aryl-alcohol dehydrogenase (NADP+)
MYAWQFSKAQYVAERHGWTRFASMQSQYNLLYREEEREMFPLCGDLQVGLIPWSPLARGRLTRDWDKTTARGETDARSRSLYRDGDRRIVEQVTQVAQARGVSRAQIALAWVLGRPRIDSAIVGATSTHHLREALDTLELALTPQEREQLEAPYEPRAFVS